VPATTASEDKTVTLRLTSSSGAVIEKVCGVRAAFASYRVEGRVPFSGTVTPAPAGSFKVKAVVKRCFGKSFQVVKTLSARGAAGGSFTGSFPVYARSHCYVQVFYGSATSGRRYFRVR
jgi:hypothetical protein